MLGLTAWRNREKPANPGNNPKKVGVLEIENCGRFPWLTNRPPVTSLRRKNAPPVWFVKPTLGAMFHRPCEKRGRPKLKFQSTVVSNERAKTRRVVSAL